MRVIILVIKYKFNRPVAVEYREERVDSLLPLETREFHRLVDVNVDTGEYTVEISRIAHE